MNSLNPAMSAPETSGGSPGAILRRCREFHEISLEEAAEATKIGITHLKALEEDRIRDFANQAYLKGFLRIYATYLGLNSDDIARMYEKLFGVNGEKPDPTRANGTLQRKPRRLIPIKKLVFPAVLLVVILATATFFRQSSPPIVRPLPVAVIPAPVQSAAVQSVQSSVQVKKIEPVIPLAKIEKKPVELPDSDKPVAQKRPADAPKGFILKIKVTQNGALTAIVDGSPAQQYDLASGDVIEWKAEKKVTLELSNAGGVEAELNGKPYKSFGPPGKAAYVELDADSLKQ
jgi:cytoskeletal protein RodZ